MTAKTKHPGKTPEQRRALDAIGGGDFCPPMAPATRDALLKAGLIVQVGAKGVWNGFLRLTIIPTYKMPIPVHTQWCEWRSENCDEDEQGKDVL